MNGAFLAMDLENCLRRIVHPISSLCSQRLGIAPNVAKYVTNTLCKMKHYVRTAYGDSEKLVAYQQRTASAPAPHVLGRPTRLSTASQTIFRHELFLGTHSSSMVTIIRRILYLKCYALISVQRKITGTGSWFRASKHQPPCFFIKS